MHLRESHVITREDIAHWGEAYGEVLERCGDENACEHLREAVFRIVDHTIQVAEKAHTELLGKLGDVGVFGIQELICYKEAIEAAALVRLRFPDNRQYSEEGAEQYGKMWLAFTDMLVSALLGNEELGNAVQEFFLTRAREVTAIREKQVEEMLTPVFWDIPNVTSFWETPLVVNGGTAQLTRLRQLVVLDLLAKDFERLAKIWWPVVIDINPRVGHFRYV